MEGNVVSWLWRLARADALQPDCQRTRFPSLSGGARVRPRSKLSAGPRRRLSLHAARTAAETRNDRAWRAALGKSSPTWRGIAYTWRALWLSAESDIYPILADSTS